MKDLGMLEHQINDMLKNATTSDKARQSAIDWQSYQSMVNLSSYELIRFSQAFQQLAKKFDLEEEFRNNGII